ncbi:hypothetical protein CLOP_g8640, partial [Closterium sp. NIES-67]
MAAIQQLLSGALGAPCSLQSQLAGDAVPLRSHAKPSRAALTRSVSSQQQGSASASASASLSAAAPAASSHAGRRGKSLRCRAQAAGGEA